MRKTLLSTLVAGAFATGMAVSASAAPITTFYYNAYGGFISGSDVDLPPPVTYSNVNVGYQDPIQNGNPPPPPPPPTGYAPSGPKYPGGNGYPAVSPDTVYQQVSWGTAQTGHSNLVINEQGEEPPVPPWNTITGHTSPKEDPQLPGHEWINGAVDVSNEFGSVMGWLTHHNEVISEPFLGTVGVHYHLDYYADEGKTQPVWSSGELEFVLQIWETPNATPCPPDQTEGTVCDDRFGYKLVGGPDFGDPFDLPLGSFNWLGTNYVVSSSGFFDASGDLLGFAWSGEEMHNTFYVNHEVHVPEPASLALMGLGLAALGATARRRKQTPRA